MGISASSACRLRIHSPAFAAAQAGEWMRNFEQAMERAAHGDHVPVYRAGRLVGIRHRFDNRRAYAACCAQPPSRVTNSHDLP